MIVNNCQIVNGASYYVLMNLNKDFKVYKKMGRSQDCSSLHNLYG